MNSRSSSLARRRLAAAVFGILLASAPHASPAPPTLQSAQEALARGDVAKAAEIYGIVMAGGESSEAELGIVRTALQAGEFREAVAYANEFAAEPLDSTEAAARLAFILDRSGRTEPAEGMGGVRSARGDPDRSTGCHATLPEQTLPSIDGCPS